MAEYPTSKLQKALARRGFSTSTRPVWQELLDRHDTVPSKSIMAPEIIKGFQGSWAAQFTLGEGQRSDFLPEFPAPVQRQVSHLGQPGLPEINFRPYDWGTTRHGKHGPSLLGHPVSFQVVGPTLKSPHLRHQWRVDTTGAADILTLDSCTWDSTALSVVTLASTGVDTLPLIYGISSIPDEGLYLVVSQTSRKGHLDNPVSDGGLGDGMFGEDLAPIGGRQSVHTGNFGENQRPKYEIFRVTNMDATSLYLDSGKRLEDYFTVAAQPANTPIIRAVTLIKPAAARLVAVPGSGVKGREQTFAFVPPKAALNADLMPPAAIWASTGPDPWMNFISTTPGDVLDYPQDVALPIPRVIRRGVGRLQGINGEAPTPTPTGTLLLVLDPGTPFDATTDIGKIVRIYGVNRTQGADWATATLDGGDRQGDPELDHLLGYWEVMDTDSGGAGLAGEDGYLMRMVTQVDPLTGVPFFGSTDYMHQAQTGVAAGMEVRLQWTFHDPISELWTSPYPQPDKLNSARLRHIIDPDWVAPTTKNIDLTDADASPSLPDRAIFATGSSNGGADGSNENPGSLLDLGFRVVLFPAIESPTDPNKLIANFDNPITSNEVVLDPALPGEKQFIEIDYSAGLVYLSHPPTPGTGCQLMPDDGLLTHVDNPRGEVVFFASFVPFSREPGQMSPAPRVTGGRDMNQDGSACIGSTEATDLYGKRLYWPAAAGQTITSGPAQKIKLAVQLSPIDIPQTGFIELVRGTNDPLGANTWEDGDLHPISTFGYNRVNHNDVANNGGNTTLEGCYGGGINAAAITTTALSTYTVVLRRDVVTPNLGDGSHGTNFRFDTTYGHNKRPSALRFKRANMVAEPDGSVTVDTRDPLTENHQKLFAELFSSWVIRGGELLTAMPGADAYLAFDELVVLIHGIRTVMPAQTIQVSLDGTGDHYVYIDGSNPSCPVYANTGSLPLPNDDDVLLGQYTDDTVAVTAYQDLRQPLVDSDKRLDITVGAPVGFDQPGAAHFSTLADAVLYVAEVMDPVAGSAGRYRRIKVIGPTQEDSAKLPIRPRLSGLIIEGAARRQDGSPGAPQAISWGFLDATAPALFDLSECHGITFRDLTFHFVSDGPLPPSIIPRERCLFTCDYQGAGVLTDAVFENIRLHGPAHGFFYCADDLDAGAGFKRLTFRNCVAEELTDFAIFVLHSAIPSEWVQVDKCRFIARKATDPLPRELGGVANHLDEGVIHNDGDGAEFWSITDTYLEGGTTGIILHGKRHHIQNTVVLQTDQKGVILGSQESVLDHLNLQFVHTQAPLGGAYPGPAVKVGIYLTLAAYNSGITNCLVNMDTPGAGDYGIYISNNGTASRVGVRNNLMDSSMYAGPYNSVEGNRLSGTLTLGQYSVAVGNIVEDGDDPGDIVASQYTKLMGNLAEGRFNGAADCQLSNNWFQGTTTDNYVGNRTSCSGDHFDGTVVFTQNGVFTGCTFHDGITQDGVTYSVENRFHGCYFKITASVTLLSRRTVFQGCYFESVAATWPFIVDGYQNTFNGNHFDDGFTLVLLDVTAGARTELVVVNNRMLGAAEGGMAVVGNHCTIEGNHCLGHETVSGTPNIYSLNVDGDYNILSNNDLGKALLVVGDYNILGNNQCAGNFRVVGDWNEIHGNVCLIDFELVENPVGLAGRNIVSNNHILGTMLIQAVYTTCQGNRSGNTTTVGTMGVSTISQYSLISAHRAPTLIMYSDDTELSGSYIGEVWFLGTRQHATGNRFATKGNLGTTVGAVQTCTGNFFGVVVVTAANKLVDSVFSGNTVIGPCNFGNGGVVSLDRCSVTGNIFTQGLEAEYSDDCTFAGNRVTGDMELAYATTSLVVQGNRTTADLKVNNSVGLVVDGNQVGVQLIATGCTDYIINGNRVGGDLLVDADGYVGGGVGILVGNRATTISIDLPPNAGQVDVANRTTNAVGNTNFNTAPGVVTVVADNSEV